MAKQSIPGKEALVPGLATNETMKTPGYIAMAKQFYEPGKEALITGLATNESMKIIVEPDNPRHYMVFSNLKSNKERYIYARSRVPNLDEIFPEVISGARKCSMTAEILKIDGNSAFKLRQYEKAHELFTLSAAYAVPDLPNGGGKNTLALAIANRSTALYYSRKYREALIDIENALHFGYPEDLRYKLYDRKGKCYQALKSYKEAEEAFKLAANLLDKTTLSALNMEGIQKQMQENIDFCIRNQAADVKVILKDMNGELPKLADGPNPTHPSLSAACRVEYKPGKGRCVVAARDIKPGEVLLVEKPFASVFKPNEEYKDCCHHCFYPCDTLLPCLKCTRGRYCSIDCRDAAWESYHKYECGIPLQDLVWEGSWEHLCVRIVLVAGLDRLLDFQQQRNSATSEEENPKKFEGCNEEGKYLSCDYTPVYHLQPKDVSFVEYFPEAFTSLFLTKLLEKMGFFDSTANEEKETAMICVGECLITHLVSRFHDLHHNILDIGELATVGATALPTYSLFNHSCDWETTNATHGNNVVIYALQTFKEGQEVTLNYGKVFSDDPKGSRRKFLKEDYSFDCCCKCCKDNWPLHHNVSDKPTFKCSECETPLPRAKRNQVQCRHCKLTQNVKSKMESLKSATNLLVTACESGDNSLRLQYIETMDKLVVQPFRDYVTCKHLLVWIMSLTAGSFVSRH